MLWKVDVSKNTCDGEHQFSFKMNGEYKVSCVKILIFS